MFKTILPNEANLQSTQPNPHLQNSAYRPLATALLSGAARVKASLRRLRRFKNQ